MDGITQPSIVYRSLAVMAADPHSPLDRSERIALISWLQGIRSNILILLPHDLLPQLMSYIQAKHPCLYDELIIFISSYGLASLKPSTGYPKTSFDSPLEIDFFLTWHEQALDLLYPLTPQHPVKGGAYRLDFAFPPLQFGIELDGYTYHGDREAFTRDRQRQRKIEALGWRIIRFSGDELRANIVGCVQETAYQLNIWKRMKE